jgi:NTP pyrophosphatase (non-canonical NTP hydrolase)
MRKILMKMNGRMKMNKSFTDFFNDQVTFQKEVNERFGYGVSVENIPEDNVEIAKYHMLALMEETGELAKSDKRWKNYRNTHFDKNNKLEELSDCFITLFNVAMYSGISAEEIELALTKKMDENMKRIREA